MIIDAKNLILGRLASFSAEKALLGEPISIINCESAVITGNRKTTVKKHLERMERGSKSKGPFTYKRPEMFVKRTIRGMLPYKKENGRNALKKIKCYIGVPENLKGRPEQPKNMGISKLSVMKYTTVNDVCKVIGGKL